MLSYIENIKKFLVRLTPKIAFTPEPMSEFSLSLGITPQNYEPEEILQLPEIIGKAQGVHIVVCINEFQQIGEMPDSLTIQKRLRGVWQHQRNVSYCLFGSKKYLMTKLFQHRTMPFYQFGEMMYLDKIPTADWVPFICSRFESHGKQISEDLAQRICETVEGHSSYVQQLAWNVLAETEKIAEEVARQQPDVILMDKHIRLGSFTFMPGCMKQEREGKQISLSIYRNKLLYLLCACMNITVTRDEIHRMFWPDVIVIDQSVNNLIYQLRKLLHADSRIRIENVRGVGYRFSVA